MTPRPLAEASSLQGRSEAEPEAEAEDLDALNEVVMAIDLRERGTVGCCYYVACNERLYFAEDVKLGGIDVVEARRWQNTLAFVSLSHSYIVKIYIEPTVILVSTKVDDAVIEKFDPEERNGDGQNGGVARDSLYLTSSHAKSGF